MTENPEILEGLVLWTMGHQANLLILGKEHYVDIPGRWRLNRRGKKPLSPGDLVEIVEESQNWRLQRILPRRNEFTRRYPGPGHPVPQVIAVNLDLVVIVASIAEPETAFGLIDRLLVSAELGGVEATLVVNKIDLVDEDLLEMWRLNYCNAVNTLIFTSAASRINIDQLADHIRGKRVLLAGASGIGKSTLANCIDSSLNIKTGVISEATGKGRHTTSMARLHQMKDGGWITDTPGLRECGPYGKTRQNLPHAFPEFRPYLGKCQFRDCLHKIEKGCAIREVIGTPELPEDRYNSYLKLLGEADEEQKPDYRR